MYGLQTGRATFLSSVQEARHRNTFGLDQISSFKAALDATRRPLNICCSLVAQLPSLPPFVQPPAAVVIACGLQLGQCTERAKPASARRAGPEKQASEAAAG